MLKINKTFLGQEFAFYAVKNEAQMRQQIFGRSAV
jgi:hypothetical protein